MRILGKELDAVRQLVLVDMAFNMGVPRLCKFKKMWNAVHEKFDAASKCDSRWANQVNHVVSNSLMQYRNILMWPYNEEEWKWLDS